MVDSVCFFPLSFPGKSSSTSTSAAKIGETDTTDNGVGETMLPAAGGTVVLTMPSGAPNGANAPPTPDPINNSILRPTNLRQNPLDAMMEATGGDASYPLGAMRRDPQLSVNSGNFDNTSVLSSDSCSTVGGGYGDPNQVGLPVPPGAGGVQKRWIPHQQRELLEKQAQLLLSGAALKRKRETEIF
uniref:Uncharacterized protein n=1 Tax=Anopheles farauti TaxID=69004 RepID=A0A182QY98_9DIPT